MHIVVAILLGIVFWKIGNGAEKALTNSSCIFFVVMFVFFGNAMPSIFLCPQECAVFIREYLNGWYSIKAYYMAKIVSDLPLQFICPTLLMSIAYYMTGQPHDVGRFVMCWGICLLTAIIGHFIGLVFGSLFDMQVSFLLNKTKKFLIVRDLYCFSVGRLFGARRYHTNYDFFRFFYTHL